MKKVSMLDCTLRDGGYVNDWEFGHSAITGIYKRLDTAGVDFIEVGFLDERRQFDINRTIAPDTSCFDRIFEGVEKGHAIPVAMVDFGTCRIRNIAECQSTFIDGIRVIFKKERIDEALPFCRAIKEKGYKLFIQAISITAYSDLEIIEYVRKVNEVRPYAFSIVDTYGLLDDRGLKNYFYIIDNNLDSGIRVGYHAHNNFQLAFSNTMRFLAMDTQREILADSTVYGMGKSAGNCPSELLAMHLNRSYGKSYDVNQFLEILDTELLQVYQRHYWGYRYNFYISAMQNCHPGYVQYLLDKKTLTVSSVNEILSGIPDDKRLLYDEQYIERAYVDYQSGVVGGEDSLRCLSDVLGREGVVLLGPGSSMRSQLGKVKAYIRMSRSTVISVNFIPPDLPSHYIFISNAKRFDMIADMLKRREMDEKLIITSNVTTYGCSPKYVLNYGALLEKTGWGVDNALILCLTALLESGVEKVALAGFDGFGSRGGDYYDASYSFVGNEDYLLRTNEKTGGELKRLSSKMEIEFLTESIYRKYVTSGEQDNCEGSREA